MSQDKAYYYLCDGCGNEWLSSDWTDEEYFNGHSCPQCGRTSVGVTEEA